MTIVSRVLLRSEARETIIMATRATQVEACGLLFGNREGDSALISDATVAANVAEDPRRHFEVDPAHLFAAARRHRAGPERLLGVWHSHPDGNARPSTRDAAGVTDREWIWLIATIGELAAWLPDGDGFRRLPLAPAGDMVAGSDEAAMVPPERQG